MSSATFTLEMYDGEGSGDSVDFEHQQPETQLPQRARPG
jgi:hypothetical protein